MLTTHRYPCKALLLIEGSEMHRYPCKSLSTKAGEKPTDHASSREMPLPAHGREVDHGVLERDDCYLATERRAVHKLKQIPTFSIA